MANDFLLDLPVDQAVDTLDVVVQRQHMVDPLIQRAMVLALLRNDPQLRIFNGEGIYQSLTKVTTGATSALQSELNSCQTYLKQLLNTPTVQISDLYFTIDTSGTSIQVTLHMVKTTGDTVSAVVIQ
jgi:hypothetical protein